MNRKLNPKSVSGAVRKAVFWDAEEVVDGAVSRGMWDAVDQAVWDTVVGAARGAESLAIRESPPHPNLQRFVGEVYRARWGAA